LELIYEITKHNSVKKLLNKFSVELGSLEDAYITSRYVSRSYSLEEIKRLKETVDGVINIVRETIG